MNRRHFLESCAGTLAVLQADRMRAAPGAGFMPGGAATGLSESSVGKPCNLAAFGVLQSWLSPETTPIIQRQMVASARASLSFGEMPWKNSEFDLGVEWPEFRTVHRVVLRFAGADHCPEIGKQFIEFWDGLTGRQGNWRTLEDNTILGIPLEREGSTWSWEFPQRRTCKVRLRLQGQKHVTLDSFEVYGPSQWKSGEVYIEWGHLAKEQSYDGALNAYNGVILELQPFGDAETKDNFSWTSTAGNGKLSGVTAKVLYTSGMDVDRTIVTARTKAFDFSFLPGEALEDQPIDAPDFGVFIRNNTLDLHRDSYRRSKRGNFRIIDAVRNHPEQTLKGARRGIRVKRVTLSFVGVDSNSQKFGIAPDGHWVIGNNDPSCGQQIHPKFAVYFASAEALTLFQAPNADFLSFPADEEEKHQELEEGWLPILLTRWSRNDVGFERLDYAALADVTGPPDESKLMGDELAVMISRLTLTNKSPEPKTARYYFKPWKPANGRVDYGAMPANVPNAWETRLDGNYLLVAEGDEQYAFGYIDAHGRGVLALETAPGAVRYEVKLEPGEQHVIHIVTPGRPLANSEQAKLRGLDYESVHQAVGDYWKARLQEGMQVRIPDEKLQNVYNATLQHFLLVLTKDGKRQEHYPNTAMLYYGSIGSESSPVIQSLDMRGLHQRAASCLHAWISTQGDSMPQGDYDSKEGGFYHFWPNYTSCQGGVLWALAEHYLYTRDQDWLRKVAPNIIAGCDFLIRERRRTMKLLPGGRKPLHYGFAPAGCIADSRDWEYSFIMNAYFYLGLKKSAQILRDVDEAQAQRIAAEAEDYLQTLRHAANECAAISPVTRLRDGTSVPSVPSYVGLRGLSTDVKDSADPDLRHGYGSDSTTGPLHLVKGEVLAADDPLVTAILNYLEDRFFMYSPLSCRVDLDNLTTDWFNLGGFDKLQPYYCHYQDAYLRRDEIPNFLRGFFNTMAAISDPMTLTFQEELDFSGGQPHKTHEEGWFFHQLRHMLVMEMEDELYLARGTPREWLEDGKVISVERASTYFGEMGYRIESFAHQGRIEATVRQPTRNPPSKLYLRLRAPRQLPFKRVTIDGGPWQQFDAGKEWIALPRSSREIKIVAYY